MTTTATLTPLSNKARVERMPSGEVVVRDVPIFSEIRLGDPATKGPGGRPALDEAWLQRAVELHNARADLGHLPPLNLRHTFNGPKNVGKYRLRRVDKIQVNPQDAHPRATIFGDEIFPNEQAFEEAKDHPYRSPEISPDWPEEFGPLALLREASPFNKYPNLDFSSSEAALAFEARGGFAHQIFAREAFEIRSPNSQKEGGPMPPEATAQATPKGNPHGSMDDMMGAIHAHMAKTSDFMAKCYEALTGLNKGPTVGKGEGAQPGKTPEMPFDVKPGYGDANPDLEDGKKLASHAAAPDDEKKKNDGISSHEPPAVSSARNGAQFGARDAQANGVSLVEFFSVKTQLEKLVREKDATGLCAQAERELGSLGFAASMVEALRPQMFAAACRDGKAGLDAVLAPARTMQQQFAAQPGPYASLGQASRGVSGDPEDLSKALQTFGSRPGTADVIRSTYADYCAAPELQRLYSFEKICQSDPRLNPAAGGRR